MIAASVVLVISIVVVSVTATVQDLEDGVEDGGLVAQAAARRHEGLELVAVAKEDVHSERERFICVTNFLILFICDVATVDDCIISTACLGH